MNERWTDEALCAIDDFQTGVLDRVEDVQAKLQLILTVWEGRTAGPEYDAIDLAENALEGIMHTRPLGEQREAAVARLGILRSVLQAPEK